VIAAEAPGRETGVPGNDAPPRVAVILLNYNGLELTRDCLRSLARVDYPAFRSIVVDNGSAVDETIPLREEFGDTIDLVRNDDSKGFCAGNNQAMRLARAEDYRYLLLLNNDTTVEPDFLRRLVDFLEADRSIGIAGPKVVRYYDRSQLDSIGGDVRLVIARHVHYRKPYTTPRRDLTFVHGCAFMVRRETAEQVGFLDEDYYAYWEETDYCLRARRIGWRIGVEPAAVVYHKVGQTNRYLSNFYIYYMIRNGLLCMRKNGRAWEWPTFLLCFLIGDIAKYGAYLLVRRPRDLPVLARALSDFVAGRLGRRSLERTATARASA